MDEARPARRHRGEEFDYEKFVSDYLPRMASLVSSAVLWYISVTFSADFFGFVAGNKYEWVGWLLAICGVTVPEVLFNNGHYRKNPTVTLLSICAYAYGIVSNVGGLWVAMGSPDPMVRPLSFAMVMLAAVPAGLFLEIAPEPMLNIGLGIGQNGYDFMSQIMQLWPSKGRRPSAPTRERFEPGRREDEHRFRPQRDKSGERVRCKNCGSSNMRNGPGGYTCQECGCHKIANAGDKMQERRPEMRIIREMREEEE